jgi:hypothetical protein
LDFFQGGRDEKVISGEERGFVDGGKWGGEEGRRKAPEMRMFLRSTATPALRCPTSGTQSIGSIRLTDSRDRKSEKGKKTSHPIP